MKSGKQRRLEIKETRRKRAEKITIDTSIETKPLPTGSVKADHNELMHNNTYGPLPLFYIDKIFTCRGCGANELWTAKQQKWWYEVAKGHIDSTVVNCRKCRDNTKAEKDRQREHMDEMASNKPHPNEAFLKTHNQSRLRTSAPLAARAYMLLGFEENRNTFPYVISHFWAGLLRHDTAIVPVY